MIEGNVNKLILGTVQLGINYGINNTMGKITSKNSKLILSEAYQNGIHILDTAEAYGNAHQVIGDFHRQNNKLKFKIITKFSAQENLQKAEIKILQYLKDLNVDQLEGLMFHSYKAYNDKKVLLPEIESLQKTNIIKYIGVSVYTNQEFENVINDDRINLIQLPFNLIDNISVRGQLLEKAKRKGKIIHTRSVFLQGLFFKDPLSMHPVIDALQPQLKKIHNLANDYQLSIEALALNYCLQQPNIDQVIIGIDSLKQLKSNLAIAGINIPSKIITDIDKIKTKDLSLLNPSLWPQKH
jgi:aryl-alcohol dehydrogenase-like predicted oxidoreductase